MYRSGCQVEVAVVLGSSSRCSVRGETFNVQRPRLWAVADNKTVNSAAFCEDDDCAAPKWGRASCRAVPKGKKGWSSPDVPRRCWISIERKVSGKDRLRQCTGQLTQQAEGPVPVPFLDSRLTTGSRGRHRWPEHHAPQALVPVVGSVAQGTGYARFRMVYVNIGLQLLQLLNRTGSSASKNTHFLTAQ